MITPYFGEFLVSPIPLEMSLNACSYRCAYCFANLNDPDKQFDAVATLRLLRDFGQRQTPTARLLQDGYPIVISNRSDPFATSCVKQTLPILETMVEVGVPVMIQTKGGSAAYEAMNFLRPTLWYISLAFLDDAKRRAIEPQAPTVAHRLQLMADLTAKGHRVVLGLNPCVPEWLGEDGPRLLAEAKAAGVTGVWIEHLHLNRTQTARLSAREHAAITQPVIERAQRRTLDAETWSFIQEQFTTLADLDLPVFSIGQPLPSTFWQPARDLYPQTFPTLQDFVNACHASEFSGLIAFDDFADFMGHWLPTHATNVYDYIATTARNVQQTHTIARSGGTFRDLLRIIWQDTRCKQNPARMPCFAYAMEGDTLLVDANDLPFLVFIPEGVDDLTVDVQLEPI